MSDVLPTTHPIAAFLARTRLAPRQAHGALALWPLCWLARRFGGEVAGLLAAALFALNPYLIRVSVNGMETSLGLLLLLTLFVAVYRLDLARAAHVLHG